MPSPVTFCRISYPGILARYPDGRWRQARGICDNPVAPCSVESVEHESHNWLDEDAPWIEPRYRWRHCEGVSNPEERAAG